MYNGFGYDFRFSIGSQLTRAGFSKSEDGWGLANPISDQIKLPLKKKKSLLEREAGRVR